MRRLLSATRSFLGRAARSSNSLRHFDTLSGVRLSVLIRTLFVSESGAESMYSTIRFLSRYDHDFRRLIGVRAVTKSTGTAGDCDRICDCMIMEEGEVVVDSNAACDDCKAVNAVVSGNGSDHDRDSGGGSV